MTVLATNQQATVSDDEEEDEDEQCRDTDEPLEKGPASDDTAEESDEATFNDHNNGGERDPPASSDYSLPLSLRILFSFNGVTLALPSTALMYMVNDVVALPVSLLPTYAAIAFLPCSLRPLYALWNSWLQPFLRRDQLLALLLVANAASIGATAWIPTHGVAMCFVLAFARGVTSSWAEFLLGLVLLQQIKGLRHQPVREPEQRTAELPAGTAASLFQAQAATARNVGSLASYATAGVYFAVVEPQLNRRSAGTLLHLAGLIHVVGAILALASRMGLVDDNDDACDITTTTTGPCSVARWNRTNRNLHQGDSSYQRVGSSEAELGGDSIAETEGVALVRTSPRSSALEMGQVRPNAQRVPLFECSHTDPQPSPSPTSPAASSSTHTFCMVLALQVSLILLTTRQPIVDASTPSVWIALMMAAIAVLLTSGCYDYVTSLHWDATHRIGLFLILRHALPSSTYLLDSYVYTLLLDHPLLLQVLSVHTMGLSTLAAWSYGKLWSPGVSTHLYQVMAVTTVLASGASLSQMAYVNLAPHLDLFPQMLVIALVQSLVTVTGEWRFLPDVVLATIGAVDVASLAPTDVPSRGNSSHAALPHEEEEEPGALTSSNASTFPRTTTGRDDGEMQYGTLISCIDFGGQVGALLAGPLVTAFHVERDNDWAHLDALVGCTSLLGAVSLLFLLVLPGARCPSTRCPSY